MSAPLIGIDTNVIIRLLAKGDQTQFNACVDLVRTVGQADPLIVNPLVATEAVWALERGLKLPFVEARKAISQLLQTREFMMPSFVSCTGWQHWFGERHPEIFDVVIASTNLATGCEFTYTLDRRAARDVPGMKLLS